MKFRLFILFAFVASVGAIWFFAQPYLTVRHMRTSIERADADALSRDIDFPALRSNLREQLNFLLTNQAVTQGKDNPFAALGALFGATMIDRFLDAYVTPYGVSQLFNQATSGNANATQQFNIDKPRVESALNWRNCSYETPSRFLVTIEGVNGARSKLVLSRSGASWRLTNIIVP